MDTETRVQVLRGAAGAKPSQCAQARWCRTTVAGGPAVSLWGNEACGPSGRPAEQVGGRLFSENAFGRLSHFRAENRFPLILKMLYRWKPSAGPHASTRLCRSGIARTDGQIQCRFIFRSPTCR